MTAWITNRPRPLVDGLADRYWQAVAEGRLDLPRCVACAEHFFPPRVCCPRCWGTTTIEWAPASGRGVVHACSVVHRAPTPTFNEGLPYVVALIELAEGVRMMSNVVGCAPDDVHVGMEVNVDFDDGPDGRIPVFVPAAGERP